MKIDRKQFADLNICIDDNAGECIEYAQQQLQFYLKKITGFSFATKKIKLNLKCGNWLFFGRECSECNLKDEDFDKIFDDGFKIDGKNGNLTLKALTERGILYAVYHYLENFYNVRFLTNDFEVVPEKKEIIMPDEEILSNPDFLMRGYFTGNTYEDLSKCGQDDFNFIGKNRTKDIFMKIPRKFGGDHKVYGRNYVHNFHYFVPFEKYGNSHPEWYRFFYALGRITPTIDLTNGITDDGKLDETMEESVAKVVISEMIKDAEDHPEKEIFNFTQEDGEYHFQSERADAEAQKYKLSGILVRFCNVLESEVNKYLKEKYKRTIKIVTFAYSYTKEAPVKWEMGKCKPLDKSVVVNENVIIQLALFPNGAYSYFSPKQDESVRRNMVEWKAVANHFWFWMYDINFHKYLYYYDSFDQIGDNIRGFKNYGISYIAVNGPLEEGRHWQCNIRSYAYRKLMWNCMEDPFKLMEEYIDLYYGVAAPCVKNVIKKFRENAVLCRNDSEYKLITRGTCENFKYTPKSLLIDVLNIIKEGEETIEKSKLNIKEKEIYKEHLSGVKATPLLMRYDMYFDHEENPSLKEYLEIKELFFKTCKIAKIHMAGEHWTIDQFREECDNNDREKGRIL